MCRPGWQQQVGDRSHAAAAPQEEDRLSTIDVRPASHDRFADVATMLGPKRDPDASVCWCLSHRVGSRLNRELVGPGRRRYVEELTTRPVAPGVLAYQDDTVVGWAAVAPRSELPFQRSRLIPHVDDLPVWSLWCIRVRPGHRRQGISLRLLEGAVDYAASCGAPVAEGYPADTDGRRMDTTMAFVGTRSLFERAGFTLAARTDAVAGGFPRVLMRRQLG